MNVFVFGANEMGRHGAGTAKEAVKNHGATWGFVGRMGRSYGIPTKESPWSKALPLPKIQAYVTEFLEHARAHPEDTFNVVAIGCGLAGLKPHEIAPMFAGAPDNVNLPPEFRAVLGEGA